VQVQNAADNPRIASLFELMRTLSLADTPVAVLGAFAQGYWPLHPVDYMISISRAGLPDRKYRLTRQMNVAEILAGRVPFEPPNPWAHRNSLPIGEGGFLGWVIDQARPLLIHDLAVTDDPVIGNSIAGMGSLMCVPTFDRGVPQYWTLQFRRARDGFTYDELEHAVTTINLMGNTNNRLLLVQEVKRLNEQLKQQFEEVAQVQQALLPRQLPDIPGLEIATSYLTSDQAGGDYYDFFPLEDGRWGVLIADVSGHGAAAATIMAMLHGILHAYAGPAKSPDAVMRYANRRLCDAGLEGNFVTAFFAVYDPKTAELSYARSGHNPPLLKDGKTGQMRHLDGDGGLPLGLFEPYEVKSERITLQPMDTVILYTDGITEAFNDRREMFGSERLDAALTKCSGAPECVVDSVHMALYQHTGSRTRADDQTLVALRYVGR
jgi:sigma-B regulation protein RsbU (phosphoserine phosphatase)